MTKSAEQQASVPRRTLREMLDAVLFACPRPGRQQDDSLVCVLLEFRGGAVVNLAATDGIRLAAFMAAGEPGECDAQVIMSRGQARGLRQLLKGPGGDLLIRAGHGKIRVIDDGGLLSEAGAHEPPAGRYPDWRRMWPEEPAPGVIAPLGALTATCARLLARAEVAEEAITTSRGRKPLRCKSALFDCQGAELRIRVLAGGKEPTVATRVDGSRQFMGGQKPREVVHGALAVEAPPALPRRRALLNVGFLRDGLRALRGATVSIGFPADPDGPLTLADAGGQRRQLLMPMRMRGHWRAELARG